MLPPNNLVALKQASDLLKEADGKLSPIARRLRDGEQLSIIDIKDELIAAADLLKVASEQLRMSVLLTETLTRPSSHWPIDLPDAPAIRLFNEDD